MRKSGKYRENLASEIFGDYEMSEEEKESIEKLKKQYFNKFGVMPEMSPKNWHITLEEQILEAIESGQPIDTEYDNEVLY